MATSGPEDQRPLEVWREAREWWTGAPYMELRKIVDERGIRRIEEHAAPSLGIIESSGQKEFDPDQSEEWSLKLEKTRDEKIAAACGKFSGAYYQRLAQERLEAGTLARTRSVLSRVDSRPQPILGSDRGSDIGDRISENRNREAEIICLAVTPSTDSLIPPDQAPRLRKPAAKEFDHALLTSSPCADAFGEGGGAAHHEAGRGIGIETESPIQNPKSKIQNSYAPLHILSGYCFGRSTMLAEEAAAYAAQCGCPAAAIADSFSLVGALEFARACKRNGVKPLIGASIELPEGGEIVLIAKSKRGYVSLSRLITVCHLAEPRGFPLTTWDRLVEHSQDLVCLTGGDAGPLDRILIRGDREGALSLIERLIAVYGKNNVCIEIERSFLPWGNTLENRLLELAEATGVLSVAGGEITHARRSHFPAQDVLICAESLCLIEDVIGRKPRRHDRQPQCSRYPERSLNGERFLRTSAEMAALYLDQPQLLANTLLIADRCDEEVLPGRVGLPPLFPDDNLALKEIVQAEAYSAYGKTLSVKAKKRLSLEVERIQSLNFSSHFLIAWDFCRWAREQSIGMSGRGSVVDSAVAYVLGLSRIDAVAHNLHFDRFLPSDGTKRPDLDIDFEAHRRDDVRGYIVKRYGVDRVAGLAAIGAYRARGIVRDVGKVFGLPNETIGYLAKRIHGGVSADQLESALEKRPELRGSHIPKEKFRWIFALAERLMDVPTGMGLHSAGVIVSESPLADSVPVIWSGSPVSKESGVDDLFFRQIQWDKRSAKHVFDKFDVLCLRGQDVLGGVEARVRATNPDFSSERLNAVENPEVYRAMRSGELIGIPQSASPAMRQAHQRLRTANLHDASMVQAGIRPGVGGAVKLNELIARRRGKPYVIDHPDLEEILAQTYGIVVFQEQIDMILQKICGYSGGEAEDIRDAVYKRRKDDFAGTVREEICSRAIERGYPTSVSNTVYELVSQFKGYAFSQGHALAFAEVSLRSIHLMQEYPAEFFASLLSAQPAGYYGPVTIANEARSRGVQMLPLDVNRSREKFEVESAADAVTGLSVPNGAIRVGLMQLAGLSSGTRDRILEHQKMAIEGEEQRPRQPLGPTLSDARGGVATMAQGDPGSQSVWRSLGLRAFRSIFDFAAKVEPSRDELEALILAGAFDELHGNRRSLLWVVKAAQDYAHSMRPSKVPTLPIDLQEPPLDHSIPDFSDQEKLVYERALLSMDVDQHLMAVERPRVSTKGCVTTSEAKRLPPGTNAFVVGNPIRLRFPPTSSGKRVVFWDLEDETGLLNCTAFDDVYQACGHAIVCSQYATVAGTVQDRDGHSAFLVRKVFPYKPSLMQGKARSIPIGTADFLVG